MTVEPYKRLAYTWNASGEESANGLKTVVSWSLTHTDGVTHVRVEQSGFRPEDEAGYQGAGYSWPQIIDTLARVVARLS